MEGTCLKRKKVVWEMMRERGKEGSWGQVRAVGWLSLANPRRMYVIILGTRAGGGGGERQARRWREAACGHCPFAFVDLLELIYSSEEWLFAL